MTEWKPCPVCGAPDMRHEPEGDEGNFLVTCTNLSCVSNGGTNAHAFLERQAAHHVPHEPLFDLAIDLHDWAMRMKRDYSTNLAMMEGMTQAHEQQGLAVEGALEGVIRTTRKLMGMTGNQP